MIRNLALTIWLLAATLIATLPASAQENPPALDGAEAAIARLDFATALSLLGAEIEAAPSAPAPRLARAALHRRMNRPALALDDLTAILDAEPANAAARRARGDLFLSVGAFARATDDFDALIATNPNDAAALVSRARARAGAGLRALAQADLSAAAALDPDTPGLSEARSALMTPAPVAATYDPAALMDPDFLVVEGAPDAAHEAVIVHAGNDLAREAALVPHTMLAPAIRVGDLRVTHLFTYTGEDSAIWANLALICAGSDGYAMVSTALATPEARAAMDDLDAGRGRAEFDRFVIAAYAEAGLDAGLATDCAFSRTKALAYLADWTARRDSLTLQGKTLYDSWPLYVFDGAPVAPSTLRDTLVAFGGPVPEGIAEPASDGAQAGADAIETVSPDRAEEDLPSPVRSAGLAEGVDTTPPADMTEPAQAPVMRPDASPPAVAPRSAPPPAPAAPADLASVASAEPPAPPAKGAAQDGPKATARLLPDGFGPIDPDARIPTELRGIWAPSLVDCIAYTDAIADPAGLDTALPRLNPAEGPAIGTVLVTSRRVHLFDTAGSECALVAVGEDEPWTARLACSSPQAPDATVPLTLTSIESAGPAPRFAARFGPKQGIELLQCRPLGALGRDLAGLWDADEATCSLRAPVTGAVFSFAAAENGLNLSVTPSPLPEGIAESQLTLRLDGTPLGSGGDATETGWRIGFGSFEAAAEQLAFGLLLDADAVGPDGTVIWSRRLPLLGSGRAMAILETCAATP